jgi:hypothetical protein
MTQECWDIISSLPTQPSWVLGKGKGILHEYQGFWLGTWFMQGVVAVQKHFQAHHTNILLATIPKAGTTWLKAISFALLNQMHYLDTQQHPLLTNNPQVICPFWSLTYTTKKRFQISPPSPL